MSDCACKIVLDVDNLALFDEIFLGVAGPSTDVALFNVLTGAGR